MARINPLIGTAAGAASGAAGGVPGMIIGGAAGLFGSLLGGDNSAAEERAKQIYDLFASLEVPELKAYIGEHPELAGLLTPEMEQQVALGYNPFKDYKRDEELRNKQLGGLEKLSAATEGITPETLAALRMGDRDAAAFAQAQNASDIQNLAERGMTGGGLEVGRRAITSQGAANRKAESTDRAIIAGEAMKRQALNDYLSGLSSLRKEDFGELSDVEKQKTDAAKTQAVLDAERNRSNINRMFSADTKNLSAKQGVIDAATAAHNADMQRVNDIAQAKYTNELTKRRGMAGALGELGSAESASQTATGNMYSNLFNQAAGGLTKWWNQKPKDDEFDVSTLGEPNASEEEGWTPYRR